MTQVLSYLVIVVLLILSSQPAWTIPEVKSKIEPSSRLNSESEILQVHAIAAADSFVRERNWGQHTSVLRTGSGWYRVEYGTYENGVPRFVLVEPKSGKVEDSMRR